MTGKKSQNKIIEKNPQKIDKADIAVAIPSFNEEENISFVTEQIDRGFQKYFKNEKCVIINTDNNSSDRTGEEFLNTKTKSAKIYISPNSTTGGKGFVLKQFFVKIKDLNVKSAATVDADLKSITPEWIKCLLLPTMKEKYDYVVPFYKRDKNDATITNNICYPLVYGLLGYNIRQPIGGDFGFSGKMVNYWLQQRWTSSAKKFGIDIFMTCNAIKSGYKICQVNLGAKLHKASGPNLGSMFLQVTESLFDFLKKNKELWNKTIKVMDAPSICEVGGNYDFYPPKVNISKTEKIAKEEFGKNKKLAKNTFSPKLFSSIESHLGREGTIKIDDNLWVRIVYEGFDAYLKKDLPVGKNIVKLLRALYFGRVAFLINQNKKRSQQKSEEAIKKQATLFFNNREKLIKL